jgi:hypothetical protein
MTNVVTEETPDSMVLGLKTIINQLNMHTPMFPVQHVGVEDGYKFFSNSVFSIRPYWEGECTCGFDVVEEQFDEEHKNLSIQELAPIYREWVNEGNTHSVDCKLVLANFHHHGSGLEIFWHYSIGNDMYASKPVSEEEWLDIVSDCVASIIGGE